MLIFFLGWGALSELDGVAEIAWEGRQDGGSSSSEEEEMGSSSISWRKWLINLNRVGSKCVGLGDLAFLGYGS